MDEKLKITLSSGYWDKNPSLTIDFPRENTEEGRKLYEELSVLAKEIQDKNPKEFKFFISDKTGNDSLVITNYQKPELVKPLLDKIQHTEIKKETWNHKTKKLEKSPTTSMKMLTEAQELVSRPLNQRS